PEALLAEGSGRDLADLTRRLSSMEDIVVSDVLLDMEQGRITIYNLPDRAGNCSRVFQAVAAGGIVVDMIVQNITSAGRAELTYSVPRRDLLKALQLTQEAARGVDGETRVVGDAEIARLFVLGVGM